MNKSLLDILRGFQLDAEPVSCAPYGCGHINATYLAVTASGRRYILQKINHHTFRDVAGLMENITAVTEFLHTKTDDPRSTMFPRFCVCIFRFLRSACLYIFIIHDF